MVLLVSGLAPNLPAQNRLAPGTKQFVSFDEAWIALLHVRVIDGTGAPARDDQTVVLHHGTIQAVGNFATTKINSECQRSMDLTGYTLLPGLIGMHEHLFYPSGGIPLLYTEQALSAPRLYLASGVTAMRTGGSLEPYTDLNIKDLIDKGLMPGPFMDVTGPYIEGFGGYSIQKPLIFIQMPLINTPEQARKLVDYWTYAGVTSFKAYTHISHDALAAAIQAVHQHGMKITGHLCTVGFTEAAELGIDDLEHGLLVDSEFTKGKMPNVCPEAEDMADEMDKLDVKSPEVQALIHTLVDHKVAITSTLSVFEASIPDRAPLDQRMLEVMSPHAVEAYRAAKKRAAANPKAHTVAWLKKEMDFERDFVAAGGLLIAGCDPTGNGGALPGFGDQRNLELLVDAGFKPEEAIRIYTHNGAVYLGRTDRLGSIERGNQADLIVVDGNPATRISDVKKIKYVVKNGVGYDPAKLIESVRGSVGIQ